MKKQQNKMNKQKKMNREITMEIQATTGKIGKNNQRKNMKSKL
jgi:hypothetical protein